ncbi:sororin [Megalops cyprinoides]|uniref:sororin n=1 Tax=Megalops cyprinoides TaxID=118141 RepID=UPI0018650681|nr:sororin [Megalops cyprinoides]
MSCNTTARPVSVGRVEEKEDAKQDSTQRRRSARLCEADSSQQNKGDGNDVTALPAVKRSITVRKILPRKTQVSGMPCGSVRHSPRMSGTSGPLTPRTPDSAVRYNSRVSSECNKENAGRPSGLKHKQEVQKMSTPAPAPAPLLKPAVLSPIIASAPSPPQLPQDTAGVEWSRKVRRSYSRLSAGGDLSFQGSPASPPPCRRDTLFGFERLQTPSVAGRRAERPGTEALLSLCAGSLSVLEGSGTMADNIEPDINIPGVSLVKEKRRRKRVPQMKMSEFDTLAAKLNAEFEEAETFDLVVE